jgi:beta-lactamase class A
MTRYNNRPRRRGFPLVLFVSLGMILVGGVLFVSQLVGFTQRENLLNNGISIAGIAVGGLAQQNAADLVEIAYAKPVTVYYQDQPINITPDSLGFRLSLAVMMADAVGSSESNGGFWQRFLSYLLGETNTATRDIPLVAEYQENVLREQLAQIARIYDRPSDQANFDVATLTVFSGDTGYVMNIDQAVVAVDQALRSANQRFVDLPISGGTFAQPDLPTLRQLIIAYLDSKGFIYDGQTSVASVYIQDLTTGEEISILGDVAFTAASTVKVPILLDYFRVLDGEPTQDDAWLMANSLLCSANSTSNLIMSDIIGAGDIYRGIASVTNNVAYIGATNTYLTAPFIDGSPNQQLGSIAPPEIAPNPNYDTNPDSFNQTTAEDMGTLFQMIYDCAYRNSGLLTAFPDGEYTPKECRQMLELMSGLELNRLLEAGTPEGTRIAYKNGWVGEVTGVAGVVFPANGRDYVISIYIWEDTGATGFQDYIRLWPIIEDISRATWNYFSPDQTLLQPRPDTPATAQECQQIATDGTVTYQYLPPYNQVNLDDIDAWKSGR